MSSLLPNRFSKKKRIQIYCLLISSFFFPRFSRFIKTLLKINTFFFFFSSSLFIWLYSTQFGVLSLGKQKKTKKVRKTQLYWKLFFSWHWMRFWVRIAVILNKVFVKLRRTKLNRYFIDNFILEIFCSNMKKKKNKKVAALQINRKKKFKKNLWKDQKTNL